MKLNLSLRNAKTKSRHCSKRSIYVTKQFQTLRANKRAINAVISNLILIAAVIAVGFAVLFWSQYQSANYQMEYSNDVNANIAQVQEKIAFQYVADVGGTLKVYLLNYGLQNVTIQKVFINGLENSTAVVLHPLGNEASVVPSINVKAQAYFTIAPSGSSPYVVTIVTGRGSTFVGSS